MQPYVLELYLSLADHESVYIAQLGMLMP